MNTYLLSLVLFYSQQYNIDPHLAIAVIETESGFNVNAVGKAGEVGLFQLRPKYFKKYSMKQLFKPEINIKEGIKHLAYMKKHCTYKGLKKFVVCYNAGVEGAKNIKHPEEFSYYRKVFKSYMNNKLASVQ